MYNISRREDARRLRGDSFDSSWLWDLSSRAIYLGRMDDVSSAPQSKDL